MFKIDPPSPELVRAEAIRAASDLPATQEMLRDVVDALYHDPERGRRALVRVNAYAALYCNDDVLVASVDMLVAGLIRLSAIFRDSLSEDIAVPMIALQILDRVEEQNRTCLRRARK